MFHKKRDQSSLTVKISIFNLFCIYLINKTVTNLPSIMAHRRCMYRSLCKPFERAAHLENSCVKASQFRRVFLEKQRRVELKSVGNFVAKTVLVESANQFSLEELCGTQYSLKYFSTPFRPSDCRENPQSSYALRRQPSVWKIQKRLLILVGLNLFFWSK